MNKLKFDVEVEKVIINMLNDSNELRY